MIIDAHAHIFPPAVRERRADILAGEAAFAEIYANPKSVMATADELLRSMDEAAIDRTIVVNFAWRDETLVDETNEYILEAAAHSDGRLIPFVSIPPASGGKHGGPQFEEAPRTGSSDPRMKIRALAAAGARGIGELRPEQSGYDLADSDEADLLAWAASAYDLTLLVHVTEPVGHAYAGKQGLSLGSLYAFARAASGVNIIAAHWGGGLPFYALMPEVRQALETMYYDTSAEHLLYDVSIYRRVIDVVGRERILWASDFPLIAQAKALGRTMNAGLSDEEFAAISGGNAARLLGL